MMKDIRLTKNLFGSLTVSDNALIGDFSPSRFPVELSDEDITARFSKPIGTFPIEMMAKDKERILIVTDDNTRPTPIRRLMPFVLAALSRAGIRDAQITVLMGLGTHRPMSEQEIEAKIGSDITNRLRVMNHNWRDSKILVSLGDCDLGFEVIINKLALEADFIISMGNIVPHATAGFSGGGKTVMPGICGETTIADTHWKALNFPMRDILGVLPNPVRTSVITVCRKVGVDCIVDSVLAGERMVDLVVGDIEKAHEEGVKRSRDIYGVRIGETADIVVAEAFPTDIDLRQAIKAVCAADIVVRDGGVIILAAECREGVSPQFPEFEQIGFKQPEKLFQDVEEGRYENKLLAYTLVAIGRIINDRVHCILVSPNIVQSMSESLGFIHANKLQEALSLANEIAGAGSRVAVLREAGEMLPLL